MNLVVVGSSRDLIERYAPVVEEVSRAVPSRAFLVSLAPEDSIDDVTGEGTAICSNESGKQVCSELVRLNASGTACARIASAVDALLAPEIPTTLVWLGRVHTDDPVFLPIAENAHRVIIDSDYTSFGNLLHLARWSTTGDNSVGFADMAWTRIAPWQELAARFFDDKNAALAEAITSVTITQASEKRAQVGSEPMLFLGWLATRLGWKTTRLGGALGFLRKDGKPVRVVFNSTPPPKTVAPLSLAAVALEAGSGDGKLIGQIVRELGSGLEDSARDADMVEWRSSVGGASATVHRVRLGANKGAKWLERTLRRPARDAAFIESVQFAGHVLEDALEVS